MRTICDHVEDQVQKVCLENPYKHEGRVTGQWGLIDYVTVVVHVMQPDARKFYKLEEMWSDAGSVMHDEIEKTK